MMLLSLLPTHEFTFYNKMHSPKINTMLYIGICVGIVPLTRPGFPIFILIYVYNYAGIVEEFKKR